MIEIVPAGSLALEGSGSEPGASKEIQKPDGTIKTFQSVATEIFARISHAGNSVELPSGASARVIQSETGQNLIRYTTPTKEQNNIAAPENRFTSSNLFWVYSNGNVMREIKSVTIEGPNKWVSTPGGRPGDGRWVTQEVRVGTPYLLRAEADEKVAQNIRQDLEAFLALKELN